MGMAELQDQSGELIARAIEVGRFAARCSSEWMTLKRGQPSLIGAEARKKLRDKSRKDAAAMRSAAAELRAAEQAVTDARQEPDDVYEARCHERDAKLRVAEQAAAAAPATAVKLFDEEMERDRPADVGGRRFTVVLNGLVQPVLNQVEKEVADDWLQEHAADLRRQLGSFEAAVAPRAEALARLSPDGGRRIGRWCKTSWSGVLVAVVGDLLQAVDAGDQDLLASAIDALQTEQLAIDVAIELAKVRDVGPDTAGTGAAAQDGWGPDLTFKAACDVILAAKQASGAPVAVHAGDSAKREAIMEEVRSGKKLPADKASQYLTPKGRLSELGWIRRKGDRVIVTEAGAERWAEKQQRA